jgi:DNA/RNA-binding domain of Phe-tRNA-synthetase-like protein
MVTDATHDFLAVIYAPANAAASAIESALQNLSDRIMKSGGGSTVHIGIVP